MQIKWVLVCAALGAACCGGGNAQNISPSEMDLCAETPTQNGRLQIRVLHAPPLQADVQSVWHCTSDDNCSLVAVVRDNGGIAAAMSASDGSISVVSWSAAIEPAAGANAFTGAVRTHQVDSHLFPANGGLAEALQQDPTNTDIVTLEGAICPPPEIAPEVAGHPRLLELIEKRHLTLRIGKAI
jgi:hypothetical protein